MCVGDRTPWFFDEMEKAHGDVFNVLLQIFDDGCVTDSQGRLINFKNTILIMTSNIAAIALYQRRAARRGSSRARHEAVRGHFRPEFINRVDEWIVFDPLAKDQVAIVNNKSPLAASPPQIRLRTRCRGRPYPTPVTIQPLALVPSSAPCESPRDRRRAGHSPRRRQRDKPLVADGFTTFPENSPSSPRASFRRHHRRRRAIASLER